MIKQGLSLATLLLFSAVSWALDARYSGEMKDEHRIVEAVTLTVLPSTAEYSVGLIKMGCEEVEEECPSETAKFNTQTRLIDANRKSLPRALFSEINGQTADVYIERDTNQINLIRLYP